MRILTGQIMIEHLDLLLLEAASRAGAELWQPYRVTRVETLRHGWRCEIGHDRKGTSLLADTLVAANGSWEKSPSYAREFGG